MKLPYIAMVCAGMLGACGGAAQDGAGAAPAAAASDAFVAQTSALAGGANDDGEPVNVDALAASAPEDREAPALNK